LLFKLKVAPKLRMLITTKKLKKILLRSLQNLEIDVHSLKKSRSFTTSMLRLCTLILFFRIDFSRLLLSTSRFVQDAYLIVMKIIARGILSGNGEVKCFHLIVKSLSESKASLSTMKKMRQTRKISELILILTPLTTN